MTGKGVWDPKRKVESNAYNWKGDPTVRQSQQHAANDVRPAVVDLFCGCGGFSVGFEAAGFRSILGVDIHPPSLDTFAHNHPNATTFCGDIRGMHEGDIKGLTNGQSVSVLTAGVPCQGFSISNRKRHDDDERNFLFREFIRVAAALEPRVVVLENVSGLVSSAKGGFRNAIKSAIEGLGYSVHVRLLNAADYGVPQLRKRIFFVGLPKGTKWAWPAKRFGVSGAKYRTVGDAISDLPNLDPGEQRLDYSASPTTELQRELRGSQDRLLNHIAPSHPVETIDRISNTAPGAPMYSAFKQRIRLHSELPSPTQICGGIRPQFQFGHPTEARGLSIRERARIQTFPDHFFFHGGLVQGRVQTGNAVPPFLARALAEQIAKVLRGEELPYADDEAELAQMGLFA